MLITFCKSDPILTAPITIMRPPHQLHKLGRAPSLSPLSRLASQIYILTSACMIRLLLCQGASDFPQTGQTNFSRFITLPIPLGANSVSLSQYFNQTATIQVGQNFRVNADDFRSRNSVSNNFFPYSPEALNFRDVFSTFFSVPSLPSGQASINVPYCTMKELTNCVFSQKTYVMRALSSNNTVLQQSIVTTNGLAPYCVSATLVQASVSELRIALQPTQPSGALGADVLMRQAFVYYKNIGNVDEVPPCTQPRHV